MGSRKIGITAIRRVIEDEVCKRIEKENKRRKAMQARVVAEIQKFARKTPLAQAKINGVTIEVHHVFDNGTDCCSAIRRNGHYVEVSLLPNECGARSGQLSERFELPTELKAKVDECRELTFDDLDKDCELLASRVLLRDEGGNMEKSIAEVVEQFINDRFRSRK